MQPTDFNSCSFNDKSDYKIYIIAALLFISFINPAGTGKKHAQCIGCRVRAADGSMQYVELRSINE